MVRPDPDAPRNLVLRGARPEEREALEALQWCSSLAVETYRAALLANPDAIVLPAAQIAEGRIFVAEAEGRILGFGVVLLREDGDAELDGLFVEPDAWRRGIGRALVDRGLEMARRERARNLHVIANPSAESFYSACGFVRVGEAPTRFGPALLMLRPVADPTNSPDHPDHFFTHACVGYACA